MKIDRKRKRAKWEGLRDKNNNEKGDMCVTGGF